MYKQPDYINIINLLGHPARLHCNDQKKTIISLDKVGFYVPLEADKDLVSAWGDDIRVITIKIKSNCFREYIAPSRYDQIEIRNIFYKIEEVSPIYLQHSGLLIAHRCLARINSNASQSDNLAVGAPGALLPTPGGQ